MNVYFKYDYQFKLEEEIHLSVGSLTQYLDLLSKILCKMNFPFLSYLNFVCLSREFISGKYHEDTFVLKRKKKNSSSKIESIFPIKKGGIIFRSKILFDVL